MLNERPEPLVLRARGHPSIRATHDKTVELTAEPDITPRATCVVGTVAAAQLAQLVGLRGSVTVTLRTGDLEDSITGVANPQFDGGARAVIRRSGYRSPETLVTGADKAAAQLNRDLVRALADPAARVDVIIELGADAPQQTAELLVCPWRLAAALASGAGVPAAGPAAAWVLALRSASLLAGVGPGLEPARRLAHHTGQAVDADLAGIRQCIERGDAAVLVCELAAAHDEVAALVGDLARAGWAVRAIGTSGTTAALVAAGLVGAPFADVGAPPASARRRRRQVAALARAAVVGVWTGRVAALVDLLAQVADGSPGATAGLSVSIGEPDEVRLRGTAADIAGAAGDLPRHRDAVAVVDLREPDAPAPPDVAARDLLAALLDAGVAPTTISRALQTLPGISRREAYDLVLALRRRADGP